MTNYLAIGLMSGTSLDGLDICYCKLTKDDSWEFEILKAQTIPYPPLWEQKLKDAIHLSTEELFELNSEYGYYLGQTVKKFTEVHKIADIDLIASHGHTVFHQPKNKFTLQIGDGRAIKIKTQIPVVYDFRSQDVLMGGNGAPLVPIGDELLFSDYGACLNLGGFSNISLKINGKRIAFDICPVNIVLNFYAEKLGTKYDDGGRFAEQGNIIPELVLKLDSLDYYNTSYPKSLGIEWVNEHIFPLLEEHEIRDVLATFTEHIAVQISKTIKNFDVEKIIVTGGGAYNNFLIDRIRNLSNMDITIPKSELIEYKEALIFALLGVLRIRNENNVLASATGSSHDHCSGLVV